MKNCIALAIVVTAGLLTHYYYWPFVLISGFFFSGLLLIEKQYRKIMRLIGIGIIALGVTTAIDEAKWLKNLLFDNGALAVNQLKEKSFSFCFGWRVVLQHLAESISFDRVPWWGGLTIEIIVISLFLFYSQKKERKIIVIGTVMISVCDAVVVNAADLFQYDRYYWVSQSIWALIYYFSITSIIQITIRDFWEVKRVSLKKCCFFICLGILVWNGFSGIKAIDGGKGISYLEMDANDEILVEKQNVPWIVFANDMGTEEESSVFDFKLAKKICFVWADSEKGEKTISILPESSEYLVFSYPHMIDNAIEEMSNMAKKKLKYEEYCKSAEMTVYFVY